MTADDHDLLVRVDERTRETAQDVADLKVRVRALEKWAWSQPMTALGALVAGAATLWQAARH